MLTAHARQPALVWRRFFPARPTVLLLRLLRPSTSHHRPGSTGGSGKLASPPASRVPAILLNHISIYCHAFQGSRPIFDQLFRKLPILLMIRLQPPPLPLPPLLPPLGLGSPPTGEPATDIWKPVKSASPRPLSAGSTLITEFPAPHSN